MYDDILDLLPYKSSFRFVDQITLLTLDEVRGEFTLKKNAFFYEDHFPGNPVTPGVIITEIMAQIGLVVLGLNLIVQGAAGKNISSAENIIPLLSSSEVSFHKMVLPGEKVSVISRKQYFRFNKLKCLVEMTNANGELVAKGTFSGFIKQTGK